MPAEDKRSSGDPFKAPSASVWNGMVDAGDAYRSALISQGRPSNKVGRSLGILKVRNDSGAARRRGEILGEFTNPLTNLSAENIRLAGNAPATGGHFGVYLKPCPDGESEEMQFAGACLALVNISDATHEHAELSNGAYVLVSAASGPIDIIYAPAGTGELECVIRFGGSGSGGATLVKFVLNGYLTGGTAPATFRTVENVLIGDDTLNDCISLFASLHTTVVGLAILQDGKYWCINAFCPTPGYV